jgi:hypothetical protein
MRPPDWEALPALKVAAEGLIEVRKEAFLRKLGTASSIEVFAKFTGMRFRQSFLLTAW